VFYVRRRGRGCPDHGWIERPPHGRHQTEERETRGDFEAARPNVLVRHQIAGQVKQRPERERAEPGPGKRPARRAARDVERDDQAAERRAWVAKAERSGAAAQTAHGQAT
jgi:hypothetical protein